MELTATRHEYPDHGALLDDYFARGWTDGLPIVPPEPHVVEEFLRAAGLAPEEVIGGIPTRDVVVTAEAVAINAVMAGCEPTYMPVVVAAARALLDERGHAHSTTASLAGPAHIVLVNGPISRELGINSGLGCFGPGWRPNATIGRALRLVIRNACHAVAGEIDRATLSNPARFSFCFAEEESDAWVPAHVDCGFEANDSTVTVMASWGQILVYADVSTPEGLGDMIVAEICHRGTYSSEFQGDRSNLMIVLPRAHQMVLSNAGWTKADLRAYIWAGTAAARAMVDRSKGFPKGHVNGRVTMQHEDGIIIVTAGGDGLPEAWLMFPHAGLAVTKPVQTTQKEHVS